VASPKQTPLELIPKKAMATASYIIIVVDTEKNTVSKAVSFDSLGNSNEYQFSEFSFGGEIPDKKFDFQIPNGVQIMHSDVARGDK